MTSAVIESERSADLLPNATGIVLDVLRDEGDEVRRGDVLAVIDNVSLDAGAERAVADLNRLEVQLDEMRGLSSQGAVSERELVDLEYQVQTARTTAREATVNQGQTRIVAPFDGVVAQRDIRIGELASSAQRAFQVVDPESLRVVASLPERDLGRVAMDQRASFISAYDESLRASATVSRIAPVVDASSGTFRVTITQNPGETTLRPGQYVVVELEVDEHKDVLVIPRDAVVYEDGEPVIYRMIPEPPPDPDEEEADEEDSEERGSWLASLFGGDDDSEDQVDEDQEDDLGTRMVAERVRVGLGLQEPRRVEVLNGLEEDDQLIVIGQLNLQDGSRVRTARIEDATDAAEDEAAGEQG
jgi:membrane fusion protein (multidrug efflux system)